MSTSGFLYRDILKYVLPSVLFFFLFLSIFKLEIETDSILSIGILTSLLLGCLIDKPSSIFFNTFPDVKNAAKVTKWMNQNWDYRKVFYYLDKDERDYLYLTGAYIVFFRNAGFVLFSYCIGLTYLLIKDVVLGNQALFEHHVILLKDIHVNTGLMLCICLIIIYSLKREFINETKYLFYPDGQYDYFAEKVQKREKELLAKCIYGEIINRISKRPIQGIEIKLINNDNVLIKCKSDKYGFWSIPLNEHMINTPLEIDYSVNSKIFKQQLHITNYNKPFIQILV
jgi:hypothetical protein